MVPPPKKAAPTKVASEKPVKKKDPEPATPTGRSKSPGRPKSPGRQKAAGSPKSKSPSRTKSPGRPKSPARLKADAIENPTTSKSAEVPKSPTRRSSRTGHLTPSRRSPIRNSPSRFSRDKEKVKPESSIPVLSKRNQLVIESDSEADELLELKEKPRAAVRGRTRNDLIEKVEYTKEPSVESSISRISKRITRSYSQQKEPERIVHLRNFATLATKLSEFSDEDEILVKEPSVPKIPKSYDYGSSIAVSLLMILMPALGFFFYAACNEKSCSCIKLSDDLGKFSKLSTYFNLEASLGYLAYISWLFIMCALPFGGSKITSLPDKHGIFVYVANGLFTATITLGLIVLLEYVKIPVVNFILDNQLHFFINSLVVGVSLSIFAYVRSFYVPISALNPHIIGKNKLYNFFMGRELHPKIFRIIDLKMFFYKFVLISELIIIVAWISKSYQATASIKDEDVIQRLWKLQPTFVVYCLLQLLYIFDGLVFEKAWITSKEIQQEGFGYLMSVSYLLYPFMSSFAIKFIVEHNVRLAYWKLALIALTYLAGYSIARISDNQKDAFRKNPYNPSFSQLETIPTTQGKKLLSSGLWGFVRHPNYLGTIIAQLSLTPFTLCAPPVLLRYLNVIFLIHRASRDNNHCKQKYGVAWDRYCNRVRYLLVPKVY